MLCLLTINNRLSGVRGTQGAIELTPPNAQAEASVIQVRIDDKGSTAWNVHFYNTTDGGLGKGRVSGYIGDENVGDAPRLQLAAGNGITVRGEAPGEADSHSQLMTC